MVTKKEIMPQIINDYLNNVSIKEICIKYNVCRGTVRNYVNQENIKLRKVEITNEIIINMYKLYISGLTNSEIGKKLNLNRNCVAKYLRQKFNIKDSPAKRRQNIKHNPFRNMDDPDVQYWLGYICADGNIKQDSNEIRIITSLDIDYIEQAYNNFLTQTDTNKSMKTSASKYLYLDKRCNKQTMTLSFSNKEVKEYLVNLGITPSKSLTLCLNFPITFSFLRGVIDGDGHISKTGRACYITSASLLFTNQISNFLKSNNIKYSVNSLKPKHMNHSIIYTIRICSKNITEFYNYLYQDGQYFLERKKSKFLV